MPRRYVVTNKLWSHSLTSWPGERKRWKIRSRLERVRRMALALIPSIDGLAVSGYDLEVVVRHLMSAIFVTPWPLSFLMHRYRFIHVHRHPRVPLWSSVRGEHCRILGIWPLVRTSFLDSVVPEIFPLDACLTGYAVTMNHTSVGKMVFQTGKYPKSLCSCPRSGWRCSGTTTCVQVRPFNTVW